VDHLGISVMLLLLWLPNCVMWCRRRRLQAKDMVLKRNEGSARMVMGHQPWSVAVVEEQEQHTLF